MLNEENFDGYYIINCPECGKNKSYFKKGEKFIHCPVCNKVLEKKNVLKTIKKKCDGYKDRCRSVESSLFNY